MLALIVEVSALSDFRTWHRRDGERNILIEVALGPKTFERGALSFGYYLLHISFSFIAAKRRPSSACLLARHIRAERH